MMLSAPLSPIIIATLDEIPKELFLVRRETGP